MARSALGGWVAVNRLVYLGFRVVGCQWEWDGRRAMGDGFGDFRLAVGG